jgi:hypothetical protein
VNSNRSHRPVPQPVQPPLSSAASADITAVEREIATLERRLKDVESELARLKSVREKARR